MPTTRDVPRADEVTPERLEQVREALEAIVAWARIVASHRTFPFGDLDLTRAQLESLFLLAHSRHPLTPSLLAQALGVTRGAVTQLLSGLLRAGLVEQEPDATDARRRLLALSPASRERVEAFERDLAGRLAPRFAALDDAELATLARLLARTGGAPR